MSKSKESERALSPSPEPPARSVRECRLPTRLQDYHLTTPDKTDSPSSLESKAPQVAEGIIAIPDLSVTTQPSIHPFFSLSRDEERQEKAGPLLAAVITLSTDIASQGETEEEERHKEDPPGGGNLQNGAKLDDFADFTTFGIATSLLLRTPALGDNVLCVCYVLSVFVRLCFFSSGIPFMYRGLPCIYSSAILATSSLLLGGNSATLRVIAVAMILFMISQNFYPHDRVLESQAWKKVVYVGGVMILFCCSISPACVYYLLWSVSYLLFPTSLWSSKV
ncbi:transmembrane protein 269 isoform X1 [Nerophis ophidion]|uniref:transmembrane protein 269 isoform X1 n=1 Tax=Nerophis ophidion TaxID=159077 RepID=UPI002ADF94E2|nr:transmembrane protein 269 isoform X1 [Nerophis ophidion]